MRHPTWEQLGNLADAELKELHGEKLAPDRAREKTKQHVYGGFFGKGCKKCKALLKRQAKES